MKFKVSKIVKDKNFDIVGFSYIGNPKPNTAMFISKKVEHLLSHLDMVCNCLVFIETGTDVSEELSSRHAFVFSDKPQLDYANFATQFAEDRFKEEIKLKFSLSPSGYYVSEDVVIPRDAYIEPNCIIGPDVQIGKNAKILAGSRISHTTVGDDFISNEYAVVGSNGFTMVEDENGHEKRIPTLGRVVIGNSVEVGAHDNISCGSGGDTIIDDYVKLDALVHIAHDVHLYENVEVTAGGIIGGFVQIRKNAYVGINAVLRNRIEIGENALIGMGATVTKSVDANVTVAGNPAKLFERSRK